MQIRSLSNCDDTLDVCTKAPSPRRIISTWRTTTRSGTVSPCHRRTTRSSPSGPGLSKLTCRSAPLPPASIQIRSVLCQMTQVNNRLQVHSSAIYSTARCSHNVGPRFPGLTANRNTLLVPPGVCGSWPLLAVRDPRFFPGSPPTHNKL